MNAKLTIIVDSRQDVLRVPTSAVTRQGVESVVEVKQSDGTSTKVPVQTGLSDGQRLEIMSGVEEGATVILPGAVATTGATGTGAGTTPGGFTGGNFAPPIQGGGGVTGGGPP
jgi:multidrug efflux pump subunit AcrA (membrane-fusion protein)